jgi:hypothetical protein
LLLDLDLDLVPSDLEADLDRPRELLLSDLDREPLPERLFLDRDLLLLPRDLEREREYLERERDLERDLNCRLETLMNAATQITFVCRGTCGVATSGDRTWPSAPAAPCRRASVRPWRRGRLRRPSCRRICNGSIFICGKSTRKGAPDEREAAAFASEAVPGYVNVADISTSFEDPSQVLGGCSICQIIDF